MLGMSEQRRYGGAVIRRPLPHVQNSRMMRRIGAYALIMICIALTPYLLQMMENIIAVTPSREMFELIIDTVPLLAVTSLLWFERQRRLRMEHQHKRDRITDKIGMLEVHRAFYEEHGAKLATNEAFRIGFVHGIEQEQSKLRLMREKIKDRLALSP